MIYTDFGFQRILYIGYLWIFGLEMLVARLDLILQLLVQFKSVVGRQIIERRHKHEPYIREVGGATIPYNQSDGS